MKAKSKSKRLDPRGFGPFGAQWLTTVADPGMVPEALASQTYKVYDLGQASRDVV